MLINPPSIFLFLLCLVLSNLAYSHGGGLNSAGCHNERRTGGYHCHRSSYTPPARTNVTRPPVTSYKANTLLSSANLSTTASSNKNSVYAAQQASSLLLLERQKNGLLLKVAELESLNQGLLLKLKILQQENANSLKRSNDLLAANNLLRRSLKSAPQPVSYQSAQKKSTLPSFLNGVHRNIVRSKYGPPSHVRNNDGNVEWMYKSFRVKFSNTHKVIGVFPLGGTAVKKVSASKTVYQKPVSYTPTANYASQLPRYAKLDYTKSGWECIKGYRRHNNSCVQVIIPQHGKLDYTGKNWECRKGYRRHGKGCGRVQIPPHAELDYTGTNWKCRKGYRRNGQGCGRVQIPPHAELDYTGSNWKCSKGYRRYGKGCGRVKVPAHAELDYTGSNWKCSRSYKRHGNVCRAI
jgi:hypothetical protein